MDARHARAEVEDSIRSPQGRRDKNGRRVGYNWWREFNVEAFRCADHAWWLAREEICYGYETEEREFLETHPRPTLKQLLISNRGLGRC